VRRFLPPCGLPVINVRTQSGVIRRDEAEER
jgi:hypothetical protein